MIIERERFNSLTEEEIKALCSKFNREVAEKFKIKNGLLKLIVLNI